MHRFVASQNNSKIFNMSKDIAYMGLYGAIFISLVTIDYILGNGFVNMLRKLICKITCFLSKSIREEAQLSQNEDNEIPFHIPTLIVELLVLIITRKVLNRYAFSKGDNQLDKLLNESKEALRLTDEFIEKWRMRKVPIETSYLDEEPQEIKALNLEVPILHMALIDARGSSRKQIERGDAGDSLSYSDSAILSVVSLPEQSSDSVLEDIMDYGFEDQELQKRYLWDVEEEDPNVEY